MEEKFEKACEVGEIPGVVLLATDKSGLSPCGMFLDGKRTWS